MLRRLGVIALLAVMAALPLGAALGIDRYWVDSPLAKEVATYRADGVAFSSAAIDCQTIVFVPDDAVPCPSEGSETAPILTGRDHEAGEIVRTADQLDIGDGDWSVVEVPPSTSPPEGGEPTWIVGRIPALKADDPATNITVDGVALGWRGDRIVVAVLTELVSSLAPGLAAEPPTLVAVRALEVEP
jgi:hypothetical protein